MRVEYHPALAVELKQIRDYYNERRHGLGLEFIDEFERIVLRLAANPGRWMRIEGDIRRALMQRFPYIIYFRHIDRERIRITVVKHQRMHPAHGRTRK